jgi:hypothetical protein
MRQRIIAKKRTITGRGVSTPFGTISAGAAAVGAASAAAATGVSMVQIDDDYNERRGIRNNQRAIQLN